MAGMCGRTLFSDHATLATTFDVDSIDDMNVSAARLWTIVSGAARAHSVGSPLKAAFTNPYPVSPALVQFYAERDDVRIKSDAVYKYRSVGEALTELSTADIVAVTGSMPHNLPGPMMGDDIIKALDTRPDMCLVDAWPLHSARTLRIYAKSSQDCGSYLRPSFDVPVGRFSRQTPPS
jgi:hypothetical protein